MAKHKETKENKKCRKKHSEKVLPEHTVKDTPQVSTEMSHISHGSDTETSYVSGTSRDTSPESSRHSRVPSPESRPTSHKRQRKSASASASAPMASASGEQRQRHLVDANEPMASTSSASTASTSGEQRRQRHLVDVNEPKASTSGEHLPWRPGDPLEVALIPSVKQPTAKASPPALSHLILTRDDAKILQPTVTFHNFVSDTVKASKTFLYVTHTRYPSFKNSSFKNVTQHINATPTNAFTYQHHTLYCLSVCFCLITALSCAPPSPPLP